MPVYVYRCPNGHSGQRYSSIDQRNVPIPCEQCGELASRDVIASMQGVGSGNSEYASPVYSDSMGVDASQVRAAQQLNPNIKYQPDGRIRIDSHAEYNNVRKTLGFVDTSRR